MTESEGALPFRSRPDHIFPTLTEAQIARVAMHGRTRRVRAGEVLVEPGDRVLHFYVIGSGAVEVIRPSTEGETVVAVYHAGHFTGEVSMIAGGRALMLVRVRSDGELIEVSREELAALVQIDAELSEILMRAFILRRMELVASGVGDVVLIGSMHSVDTLRIKEFLTRNNHPYQYVDLDKDADVQVLLDRFHVKVEDVPVLICRGQHVLRNPSVREITDCLGFNEEIDREHVRDLIVVGAGPSGLAAAVYAASEGLTVLVIECNAPGGQAGASSRIENYLGFPEGVTGQQLANSAYTQARKFGAEIMIARKATRLTCDRRPYSIQIDDDTKLPAKSVIIATGAEYRRPSLQNLERFEGAGVYYGATFVEAQLCGGEEVAVVGGGNSAGQAAVFLAQTARKVHIVVRARGLAESMSRYLIRRIEEHPSIELHTRTDMVALEGSDQVERVRWRNGETGQVETHDIRHVFIMTGALPKTGWLDGCVALDEKGFIKTGQQLSQTELSSASWPLPRPPHLLETSLPGIFAVGDVRAGNVKRVASAVGEGSIAVSFVHQVLRE